MFKDSAIIPLAIQRPYLTKSPRAAMFTSDQVDIGRIPLSPTSTTSLPLRNREYHLKTFDWFTASFPLVFCANTSVSASDSLDLKQNFMAALFISAIHDV